MTSRIYRYLAGLVLFSALLAASAALAGDKLKIVTSLPDLADIARRVGGDRVEVMAIAKGYQDPHFVDPKPSYVLKLKEADMFVHVGLDLEVGWVPPLLESARNPQAYYGGKGYVDASQGVPLLEVPTTDPAQLRAQGDIHVYGNPHYWLDPQNGKIIANNIYRKLIDLSPDDAEYFRTNLETFSAQIDSATAVWVKRLEPYRGTNIIAYHNSWPYFEKRFGVHIAGFIEPKPGIPPTPSHLVSIIRLMESDHAHVIIISPYFDPKPAKSVAARTDSEVLHLAPSVGAVEKVKSYFDLFDYDVNALVSAFQRLGVKAADGR
jgi:zinc/manganese transport system substrate-binding protein